MRAVVPKADPQLGAEFIIDAWNTWRKRHPALRHCQPCMARQPQERCLDHPEDNVEQQWDMSCPQAYRLIDAWPLAERLSPMGDKLNERQVRELLPSPAGTGPRIAPG